MATCAVSAIDPFQITRIQLSKATPQGLNNHPERISRHNSIVRHTSMRTSVNRLAFVFLLFVSSASTVAAQETYVLGDGSTIRVDGSSNKSDWSVTANKFAGSFLVSEGVPQSGTLSIDVKEMKGGRSLIMDRLMYSSFNADEFPQISFELDAAESTGEAQWTMTGNLTISGVTLPVSVVLNEENSNDRTIRYSGVHDLKMTDYGMKPPTAMFGSLHTKDEVQIAFDLLLATTCEEECESDS